MNGTEASIMEIVAGVLVGLSLASVALSLRLYTEVMKLAVRTAILDRRIGRVSDRFSDYTGKPREEIGS